MIKKTKLLTVAVFSLLFSFLMVGYASLTTALEISGAANVNPPETVFITNAKVGSKTPDTASGTINSYTDTLLNTSVVLTSDENSQVSFQITVKNNTGVKQGFNGIRYSTQAYSNPNIAISTTLTQKTVNEKGELNTDCTVLDIGQSLTFTATYAHKDGASIDINNLTLESIVNYEFLPYDSIVPGVVDSGLANDIMEHFEDVLNNEVEIDGETMDSFEYLDTKMRENPSGRDDTYIANFGGAKDEDKSALTAIFGDNFTMNIDGTDTTVQIIVKREDVTGDGIDDFTIYMTTHSLLREDAEVSGSWFNRAYFASPIYAAVYTSQTGEDGSEVWSMIGEMYTGKGEINSYSGWSGEGSFDTRTWESDEAYGSAAAGSDIETVLRENGLSN